MCGIIGILSPHEVANTLASCLKGLQHRGQQAAGVATMEGNLMHLKKGLGLIKEVISDYDLTFLKGNAGIGHVRYPTAGSATDPDQAHPFYVNSPFGIMLAHNGNLTNADELRTEVLKKNHRHVRTLSDSEVLTNVFAFELEQLTVNKRLSNNKIFSAIENLNKRARGAYAVVSLIADYGLVAFRDPLGIRPLVLGKRESDKGITYIFSSESCTLDINGFELIRDVLPGETVIVTLDGKINSKICHPSPKLNICIFEYVYLSRPDSIMQGVSIQLARQLMGNYLANSIINIHPNIEIDVVIPVPDTSRVVAIAVAEQLGKPYREGFVKNHFVGRTFIMSDPEQRKIAVRNKLSPIAVEFKGKNVLLVDDSIVRGTTSREIVDIIRNCGAKCVYLASAAPHVRYPNVYGIDMPTHTELVAHKRNDLEIAKEIGVDKVFYQSLTDLKSSITDLNPDIKHFDSSCFDGQYITNDISAKYLSSLALGVNI